MALIEPGQLFTIGYGNERRLEVKAMAGRSQRALAKKIKELVEAEKDGRGLDLFDLSFEALLMCVGEEKATEMFDESIDAEMAIDIATKTLGKQSLSEEDKKKSES